MAKGGRNNAYGEQVSIQKCSQSASRSPSSLSPISPKTPADEGVQFFQSHIQPGEAPIRVFELHIEADGGPREDCSVCSLVLLLVATSHLSIQYIRLPPAYVPYILRVAIEAGTPAARNGVFRTNFPLDGGAFARDRFAQRR